MFKPNAAHKSIVKYHILSWACMLAAVSSLVATALDAAVSRAGNFEVLTPMKLLHFISENMLLWKSACVAHAVSSIFFVLFAVAFAQCLERRFNTLLTFALLLVAIGAAGALNAEFSMLVLASDLARDQSQLFGHLLNEPAQLGWAVTTSALTQYILIGNTLCGLSGSVLVACAILHRSFPKALAWLGIPVWLVTLNASLVAGLGRLELALLLIAAANLFFVVWAAALGIAMPIYARHQLRQQQALSEELSASRN